MSQFAPIAEGLFTEKPSLIGSECGNCAEVFFPAQKSCSKCSSQSMQAKDLGGTGALWSWTIQHFMPKPPYGSGETKETFQPFGVGLIEMACGIKVKSRLQIIEHSDLQIGDKMSLLIVPFGQAQSDRVSTFVFTKEGE